MKNKLLIQANSLKWCVYYRNVNNIPSAINHSAVSIWNCDTESYWKRRFGGHDDWPPEDTETLPEGKHVFFPGSKVVSGLEFNGEVVGKKF